MPAETPLDDLTARARIRDAAMRQFARNGYERTTIRGIAADAGVSAGLLRHHFGSKEELRDAIDAHVVSVIGGVNDEIYQATRRGDLGPAALSRDELKPYQAYIVRALVDGSPTMAKIFDQVVDMSVKWFDLADSARAADDRPMVDSRTRAAVIVAMAFGAQLLREHIARVLDTTPRSPEDERLVALALLDLYSHALITPELAATARASVAADPSPDSRSSTA